MLKHMEQKNESTPLVTVITATYNLIENKRAKFIIQCLGSVHNQHYSNIEHIVIDGASNDGTLSLLREYESHYDNTTPSPVFTGDTEYFKNLNFFDF